MSDPKVRVGVFVCDCGMNISGTVDCQAVADSAGEEEGVVLVERGKYMCSDPGQTQIKQAIGENRLDRVVVAACTPRLHEPTFRQCLHEVGMNPYLMEMANIREHCAWVHQEDKDGATFKARDLVRGAVARARLLQSQTETEISVRKAALIIGGGVAGIQAALDLANGGHKVYLVEKEASIGGLMAQLAKTYPTMDCPI
jgi:heterodisulfide reductase subunit A